MTKEQDDAIELGKVSTETKGPIEPREDDFPVGSMPPAGLATD